jgi:hypothetical protein
MDQSQVPQPWYMALIEGNTAIPKAVAKLINTVGDQIGLWLEPTHLRRKGQAEADVLLAQVKAATELKVLAVGGRLFLEDLEDRAGQRTRRREAKRQSNLEATLKKVIHQLPERVSDDPVDDDWVFRFFNNCQDVSNEQLQLVWARILAGELERPGTFSLRTLDTLRNLSQLEAETFCRLARLQITMNQGSSFVIDPDDGKYLQTAHQIEFDDLLLLREVDLLVGSDALAMKVEIDPEKNPEKLISFELGNRALLLEAKERVRLPDLPIIALTSIGKQLAQLVSPEPTDEYFRRLASQLRHEKVVLKKAKISQRSPDGTIELSEIELLETEQYTLPVE